jgi:hypothetical protein
MMDMVYIGIVKKYQRSILTPRGSERAANVFRVFKTFLPPIGYRVKDIVQLGTLSWFVLYVVIYRQFYF